MTQHDELVTIFKQRGAHDVDFPEGWTAILEDLHNGLFALDPDYRVSQIKVKFGGLRVYLARHVDHAHDLIRLAEQQCAVSCETCGGPGIKRVGYWTHCDEHSEGRAAWQARA